jgi:hypothetical protein
MWRMFGLLLILLAFMGQAQESVHTEKITLIVRADDQREVDLPKLTTLLENLEGFSAEPVIPDPVTEVPTILETLCSERSESEILKILCSERNQDLETLVAFASRIICAINPDDLGELVVLAELICQQDERDYERLVTVIPGIAVGEPVIRLDPPPIAAPPTSEEVPFDCSGLALGQVSLEGEVTAEKLQELKNQLSSAGFIVLGIDGNSSHGTDMARPSMAGGETLFFESANVTGAQTLSSSNETRTSNSIIAILDTGVSTSGNVGSLATVISAHQIDLLDFDNDPQDEYEDYMNGSELNKGHGTPIALIAHTVAPSAEILPIRICDDYGQCPGAQVALGVCYALNVAAIRGTEDQQQKHLVLNLSFSGVFPPGFDPMDSWLYGLLKGALEKGVLVATEVGNKGLDPNPRYPAAYTNFGLSGLVSVSGLQPYGTSYAPAYYSTRGNYIDIAALGGDVFVGEHIAGDASYSGGYSGNSFATPWVAGALALMLDANEIRSQSLTPQSPPELTPWQLEYCLQTTAQPPMPPVMAQHELGAGMIDIQAAVRCVLQFPN